jgi:hypothetical protein
VTITDHPTLIKLVWSGTLGTAEDEIFSYSRWAAMVGDVNLEAVMDDAAQDVTDLLAESTTGGLVFTTIGQCFPTSVKWTQLKGYVIDEATGADLSLDPAVRVLADHGAGSGLPALTNQDALAITTQALPRGPSSYNRFYLPTMMAGVLTSSGHVVGTLVDDIQTELDLANTAHKAATGGNDWEYAVYSTKLRVSRPIQRYWTGDVMDTIRRRRNKLTESRHELISG